MRGLPGRQTRGLQVGSQMQCADNTGAKVVQIIAVPGYHGVRRRRASAGIGDKVIVSVKKGTTEMRRQILPAVIIRQKRPFRRPDGMMVQFEDNAVVIITDTGETKGTDIKGAVAREAAERFPRIGALAGIIV